MNIEFLEKTNVIPNPAFGDRALSELDSWKKRALINGDQASSFIMEMSEKPRARALLLSIFGNSQFLTQSLRQEPGILQSAAINGLNETALKIVSSLSQDDFWRQNSEKVSEKLRIAKRQFSLLVAIADISGAWDLDKIVTTLSDFADKTIDCSLSHLLYQAFLCGNCPEPKGVNPTQNSGISILGMGKLGARELNYSSDIDLIVLFDENRVEWKSSSSLQHDLHRLTRDLIGLLSARTKNGYVFRTDLRLRPDAGTTPLAISTTAAERYYENLGQNWERAAMIKARPSAGDIELAKSMLETLEPFIWRKNLDFSAIQDIHSIKRQINAHKGHHKITVAGHNIKVGRGGIREIEFYAQTQQLIWGGRDESLRKRGTCESLKNLAKAGRTDRDAADSLVSAYYFLRHLEHRLQMVADEQTHTVPQGIDKIQHIAIFSGFNSTEAFTSRLTNHLESVEIHYAKLFEDSPSLGKQTGNLVFTGTEDDPDTIETLKTMGFSDGSPIAATIRGWHHGRVRSTRSTRARELLTELMPQLLASLCETIDPDSAFFHFNNFITNLPSGIQLFSLFHANPNLLKLLAEVMGSAPSLAENLSRHPELLDGLLTGDFYTKFPNKPQLDSHLNLNLKKAKDYEDILDITRRWAHETQFQVGMQLLRGILNGYSSGIALTNIAETVLNGLLPCVEESFSEQHGKIAGGGLGIVAMGKLGGKELTFLSDLDLIFLYKSPDGIDAKSSGPKPLLASQYFARLSNRVVSALTALTSEGRLYDIDTRLSPSGNSGPIASEISGFRTYFHKEAWTWEHMALTRARFVAGPKDLGSEITCIINKILKSKRNPNQLLKDVAEMRLKINTERGTQNRWKLQHVRGGLLDIEFITQYLQLRHGSEFPEILSTDTTSVLKNLTKAGLISGVVGENLEKSGKYFKNFQALLRLTVGMNRDPRNYPKALRNRLINQETNTKSFSSVETTLKETQNNIYEQYYKNIIDIPAKK